MIILNDKNGVFSKEQLRKNSKYELSIFKLHMVIILRTRKAVIWISSTLSARLLEMNQSARWNTARDHHALRRANWCADTNSHPIVGTFERHVDMTSHVPDFGFSILDGGCFVGLIMASWFMESSYKWLTGCWFLSTYCDKKHTIIIWWCLLIL